MELTRSRAKGTTMGVRIRTTTIIGMEEKTCVASLDTITNGRIVQTIQTTETGTVGTTTQANKRIMQMNLTTMTTIVT